MKKILISCIVLMIVVTNIQCTTAFSDLTNQNSTVDGGIDSSRILVNLPQHIKTVKAFALSKKTVYSNRVAFFIDMRIPSHFFRFFVVDLATGKILDRALVAHGSGSETGVQDSLQFSNIPDSYMSSLGKYKIGTAYQGNFGRSYRLNGLDITNNKALARAVVLHRYGCVPDEEQIDPICNSLGCPMVSEAFFPKLESYVDGESKSVLLEIYY